MEEAVPVLRIADANRSISWYRRLGYEQEWAYSFEPGLPVATSLARNGAARILLSEHTGDAKPEGLVCLYISDLDALSRELEVDIVNQPWGRRELQLTDPDGNRLRISDVGSLTRN